MDRPRVPELICKRIEQLVLEGALSPGEKLPAERQLADRLVFLDLRFEKHFEYWPLAVFCAANAAAALTSLKN